ncbi:uncharacterized protein LOC116297760 [Actinia tenebrosa]|uniref:Uncharacterized protein LOC116297760 n=1 Tax=Actinia tenebrosa TaxID=6105 RepID=A0A6P8I283_ACTTE|nr:uncharacterized protein LOC116297760 [Actinia tenebrosa]
MKESYDAGFESEDSEYERPVLTEKEKITVDAFLKSIFERVMVMMKKEMADTENDVPEEERIVLTVEEEKVIKEFLEKIFKQAIEIVRKETECTGQVQNQHKEKIDSAVPENGTKEQGKVQSKMEEEENTETSYSIRRKISNVLKQGFRLPGHAAPKVRPEPEIESKHSIEEEEDKDSKNSKSPYEGFVTYGGKNSRGHHVIYVDPMKAPQSHVVGDHDTFLRQLDNLLTFTDAFIAENTNGSHFILVYRCLDVSQSHSMKLKWMTKLYGSLRDRYLGKLEKLIFYKPEMKLKALVKICKPFMRRELSSKLVVVTDPVSLAREQYLPQVIQDE